MSLTFSFDAKISAKNVIYHKSHFCLISAENTAWQERERERERERPVNILATDSVSFPTPGIKISVFFPDFSRAGAATIPNFYQKWREAPKIWGNIYLNCVKWL